MLRQRAIQFDINGVKRGIAAKGCPQGGVLSPLLWNIVANDLITRLNNRNYYTVGYADDMAILISGKVTSVVFDVMQSALRVVQQWCTEYGLSVNPNKTELVLFTRKRNLGKFILPKMFDTEIQLSSEVKYLGITLDNKLSWNKHLTNKLNSATLSLWQCRRLLGRKWGIKPQIMQWLYTSIIRPLVAYGASVWWPRTRLRTVQDQLQQFQRMACMAITGCMLTTPTKALEAILGILPLHLHVQLEATLTATRLSTLKLWNSDRRATHTTILNDAIGEQPLLASIVDRIPKKYVFEKGYKIQLQEEAKDYSGADELRIYTDGSKTGAGTGAGTFSWDLNISISTALDINSSVFQAECIGISQAAEAITKREITDQKIKILSDSTAVLLALKSNCKNSALLYECHLALEEACKTNQVTLQWIRGHSGSLGNDAADELARRGSSSQRIGPGPMIPLPFQFLRNWIRQRTRNLHENEWLQTTDFRQSREALPHMDRRLTGRLLKLDRAKLRIMVGAITGHCALNKHLYNLNISDSPLCRGCLNREETAAHVLLECSSVAEPRQKFLGKARTLPEVCRNEKGLLAFLEDIGWLK